MRNIRAAHIVFFTFLLLLLCSCDKGYQVRFVNYYTEPMDSVVVGNDVVVFTGIDPEAETAYEKIKKGTYKVVCTARSKKKFSSQITIPRSGSGKRSIQIDAVNSFSILED